MPTSDHRQISTVLDVVLKRQPQSVLDIGVGWGKYGTLLREYLGYGVKIVGVEPWPEYGDGELWGREPHDAYDIVLEDRWPTPAGVVEALVGQPMIGLTLMIDVVEHFAPDQQRPAVVSAIAVSQAVCIATPHDAMQWPQDDLPNPLEKHYEAPKVDYLARVAQDCFCRLAEVHWLPDSYIAVIERSDP